jgi:hypothetical protein
MKADNHEFLTRVVIDVLSVSCSDDRRAVLIDLAWDLRLYSLYSVAATREVLVEGATRIAFDLGTSEQIDRLATVLYKLSREDCSRVSLLEKHIARLETT